MNKRIIITVMALVLMLVAGISIFNISRFRLSSSTPSAHGTISTYFKTFILEFNRDLKTDIDYTKQLEDEAKMVKNIFVEKRRIIVEIQALEEDKEYAFKIKNVLSQNGAVINEIVFDFKAKYIPYEKLSKKEQRAIDEQFTQINKKFPILDHLPHDTLNYTLRALPVEADIESGETVGIILEAKLFLSNTDVKTGRDAAINTYKQQVFDYITALGFNPSDYQIDFVVVDPI